MSQRIILQKGPFRIVEIPDDQFSIEDLKGECFDPKVNPTLDPEKLKLE